MLAEESGKKNRKGLHSSREPPVHHVNDVTLPNSANRCAHASRLEGSKSSRCFAKQVVKATMLYILRHALARTSVTPSRRSFP